LLSEAIEELRDRNDKPPVSSVPLSKTPVPLDLPIKYYIPEDYIVNPATRIQFYQKCADVYDVHGIEEIIVEMKDRFGTLPEPVENLLYAVELKLLARRAKVESIVTQEKEIIVYFQKGKVLHDTLLRRDLSENVKIGGRQIRINIFGRDGEWQRILKKIMEIESETE
jgi:transcription-repair coupling factor (superfamily II helicase)